MAISLASIYQPLRDFFLDKFKTETGSPVRFRFDKFGSVLSDSDFLDPHHPELGYLPTVAVEKFSELVNHVPCEAGDGINLVLSEDAIDHTYYDLLLNPACPHVPAGLDDNSKQAIFDAFSSVKADALRTWDAVRLESTTGEMGSYRPSRATPEGWYDPGKSDVWTSHSLQVSETETSAPADAGAVNQLWKLKLNDTMMIQALQSHEVQPAVRRSVAPILLRARAVQTAAAPETVAAETVAMGSARVAPAVAHLAPAATARPIVILPRPVVQRNAGAAAVVKEKAVVAAPLTSVALHDVYLQQYHTLDVSHRIAFNQYLGSKAPTQSVKTKSVRISFDYCLVKAGRRWWGDAFVNSPFWYVPTFAKGALSAKGHAGALPALPIGFVAVRNLVIEADWTAEDVANASQATGFGPFKVVADLVNSKLSHPGLQIIGWLLQEMPDLPPNDSPAS
ncbi:MAG TPA: hypothetical protein VF173_22150 [Thermoanaerobaculia bacterium]|nr:hypothetical protein [Thermoanaerobaculia bacterium]